MLGGVPDGRGRTDSQIAASRDFNTIRKTHERVAHQRVFLYATALRVCRRSSICVKVLSGGLRRIAFAFGRTRMSLNWCCVLISFRSFCLALYHMLSQVRAPRQKLRRATPRLPCLCCRRPQHCHGAWLSRRRIDCRCRACTIMRHSSRSQPRHWAASRLAQRSSRLPPSTFSRGTTAGS